MKKLLQINITANWGSHGKIAERLSSKVGKATSHTEDGPIPAHPISSISETDGTKYVMG